MHKPIPYGTYPLVLRNYNTGNPIPGELLFDFNSYDLYVCNRLNKKVVPIAKMIYEKSKAVMLDNTNIIYTTDSTVDRVSDRSANSFFLIGRG